MLSPEALRALRLSLGWSVDQAAGLLDVSVRTYQRYEAGAPLPRAAGVYFLLVADVVRKTRARRIQRVVSFHEQVMGSSPELARVLCDMGLEGAEAAVPADWQPENLLPCPVEYPGDLTALIPRRAVEH